MPSEPASAPASASAGTGADPSNAHTLAIDIGGTGIKMLVLDAEAKPVNERARTLTPKPATPEALLDVIKTMVAAQPPFTGGFAFLDHTFYCATQNTFVNFPYLTPLFIAAWETRYAHAYSGS